MFKIEIKKDKEITNYSEFKTEQECIDWAKEQKFDLEPKKTLRKDAIDSNLSIEGLDPIFETDPTTKQDLVFYMIPPTQTANVEDISPQKFQELSEQESSEAVDLSVSLKKYIRYLNKQKLKLGEWDEKVFVEFITSKDVAISERLLNQASLSSYKKSIPAVMSFYKENDVLPILQKIDSHIKKWQELGVL